MLRLATPVFTITLILSAFLLFSVQPMVARMILPLLGGSPSVWNTAMVFFQTALLAGYAYAHLTSRVMGLRVQAAMHLVLLLAGFAFLPVAMPQAANTVQGHPALWQICTMAMVVGLPFTVLSATSSMLQRWYAGTAARDADNPYFLYAASNAGSLAALLAYPFVIEPVMGTGAQATAWMWGYAALAVLIAASAAVAGRTSSHHTPAPPSPRPALRDKARWVALAFIPSSLMLSVTTAITTDIAAIPLLWIIPLSIYLVTFILAFARKTFITAETCMLFLCVCIAICSVFFINGGYSGNMYVMCVYLVMFFFAAMVSHTNLAGIRPGADHLTSFYLYISAGGVLGGLFNTFVAPAIFPVPFEFLLVMGFALLAPAIAGAGWDIRKDLRRNAVILVVLALVCVGTVAISHSRALTVICAVTAIAAYMKLMDRSSNAGFAIAFMIIAVTHPLFNWATMDRLRLIERNFFGVSKVMDGHETDVRVYLHGTTMHGAQNRQAMFSREPLTYYHRDGPAGDAFRLLDGRPQGPQKIGAIGLGAGSVACYARDGRSFDFFEIDPAVIRVAEDPRYFTFLSGCGSPYAIIPGDGRMEMAKAANGTYDMIFLDAFSSDSIPAHLLTLQAFRIYMEKLKDDGFLLINISNRHMDLTPVVDRAAQEMGMKALFYFYEPDQGKAEERRTPALPARFAIVARDPRMAAHWKPHDGDKVRLWTDDYTNVISLLLGKKP